MGNGGVNLVDIPCALDIYALEDEAASKFRSRRPPHPTLDLESVGRSQNWQTKVIFGIFGICQTDALLAFKHLNNNTNMKMSEFTESVVDSLWQEYVVNRVQNGDDEEEGERNSTCALK